MNHAKIPTVNAIPLRKIFCRLCPACWTKPKILSEITGNTHGIKFKMSPPRNPKSRNVKIPRAGAGRSRRNSRRTRDLPRRAIVAVRLLRKHHQTRHRRQILRRRLKRNAKHNFIRCSAIEPPDAQRSSPAPATERNRLPDISPKFRS